MPVLLRTLGVVLRLDGTFWPGLIPRGKGAMEWCPGTSMRARPAFTSRSGMRKRGSFAAPLTVTVRVASACASSAHFASGGDSPHGIALAPELDPMRTMRSNPHSSPHVPALPWRRSTAAVRDDKGRTVPASWRRNWTRCEPCAATLTAARTTHTLRSALYFSTLVPV